MRASTRTKRLQTWIVASSAVGIICVGVVVAVAGIYPLYDHLIEQEEKNLLLTLNTRTMAVEEYLARARDIAISISSRTVAREKLENHNKGAETLEDVSQFSERVLLDAMAFTDEVWGLTRFDPKGNLIVQLGIEIPGEIWPSVKSDSKEVSFSGPVILGRQPYLVIASPILNRSMEIIGRDFMLFRLFQLERLVHDDPDDATDTLLGFVQKNNVQFVFPFRTKDHEIKSVPFSSGIGQGVKNALEKRTGLLFTSGHGPATEVIAYGPIRGIDWGLVLKVDRNELYAPVNKHVLATVNLIIAMLVLGTTVMILFVRPLTGKMIIRADELEKQVQEKTADLQKELQGRKRMEQWLMDSERRYRTLLEEVPDVIFLLDNTGKFNYINTQVETLLLCGVSDLLETNIVDYVVPEFKEKIETLFTMPLDSIWDEELAMFDSQKNRKFVRIRVKTSKVEPDQTMRFEGVMRDINRRKKLEEELKGSREELLEKIKIIDDLYEHIVQSGKAKAIADHTAEVAHELRQPLAIIGGFARRIARQLNSCEIEGDSSQREACKIMIDEVQRLEKILTGLINFTRHESVQLQLADPNEIIEKTLKVHEPRMQDKNLHFKINLGKEIGELSLDKDRFEQVVRNLLSNAIEAAPKNSTIEIDTAVFIPSGKAQETGELEAESYFEIKIKNQGKIIKQADLQKIFSPFYTTKEFGTGIGLTLSKKIIEDHHGSISAKSDPDGTVFTIWLPLQNFAGIGR
jgi:PAS domain S-box-containing protein